MRNLSFSPSSALITPPALYRPGLVSLRYLQHDIKDQKPHQHNWKEQQALLSFLFFILFFICSITVSFLLLTPLFKSGVLSRRLFFLLRITPLSNSCLQRISKKHKNNKILSSSLHI